jgi:pyridoxal phosphate enzyme (YggS family)
VAAVIDAATVADRVAEVRRRIVSAGGDPSLVRLVAMTKGFGPDAVRAAVAAGVEDVGESYAQELVSKAGEVAGLPVRWHFAGRLQTNKVRVLAPHVALWHSVDRAEVGAEIARRAPRAHVLVQVNVSGEAQKGGCEPAAAGTVVGELRDLGLSVDGLMGLGPIGPPEAARPGFRRLAALADELGLAERSMGMSGDVEVAVQEGATIVRVGTRLFGARPER